MGRRPSKPGAIPRFRARVRGSKTYYFYDHGGKPRRETPLGTDYGQAIQRWAKIEHESDLPEPAILTFRHVVDAYRREVIPTKAARTQRDNVKELSQLLAFFDDPPCPLESIEPVTVRQYLTWRTKGGKALVRANREKALLSHIWNFARDKGYTALPNPCAGIKGARERGRDAYIEDAQYRAIWEHAPAPLRDAMDLAYLTGQRPGDVVKMDQTHVRDEVLSVQQGKTGTKVRVAIVGSLAEALERIRKRKAGFKVHCTRLVVGTTGMPMSVAALSRLWKAACEEAGVAGYQFRDLRAKAATDKEEATGNIRDAQRQLGHSTVAMTEHYSRNRRGAKVDPTK